MKNEKAVLRFFEVLPGLTTWIIIAMPFFIGFYFPKYLACFMIAFDFYWLLKAIFMGGYLISGYLHMRRDRKIDWLKRCKRLDDIDQYILEKTKEMIRSGWWERRKKREELSQLINLRDKKPDYRKSWKDIYNVVLLAHYKDEYNIIKSAVRSCTESSYPTNKMIIVIALEDREEGNDKFEKFKKIKKEFKNEFFDIFYTLHKDKEGELKGKSANINWAGKEIKGYIDKKNIHYSNVIVSAFDGDTRVSKEYFGSLVYKYLVNTNRTKRTYQPIPLFNNNIWEVPFLTRIVALGSSYWQMIESCRPYRLINFSSQAMSLKTLVDIDFWDETIVSEDSKQFYRAFFHYRGDHKAIPLFTPVHMDAVSGNTIWQTLKNQYYQKRRWAWGVENFSYAVVESIKHKEISFWKKFRILFRLFRGTVEWSTASLLIAFAGWMPFLLNSSFRSSVLAYNLPIMARNILTVAWIGIFVSTLISILLLPPRPKKYSRLKYIEMILQWIFIPVTAIFYGSVPAIDAQTRMMLGGKFRLGFWVTPKKFVRED